MTTNHHNSLARHAILRMVRHGLPPDSDQSADFGPWAEIVASVSDSFAKDGQDGARAALIAIANADPALAVLVAGEPPPPSEEPATFRLTDLGNAELLVAQHGQEFRFCHAWSTWLVWDGTRWYRDDTGQIMRFAKRTVREIYRQAANTEDDTKRKALANHAKRSESALRLRAMVTLSESEELVPVRPGDLDTDPWLLNCTNGTVDLQTGELREHRREDLITKSTGVPYDPDAHHALWDRFLEETTGGDKDLETFLQRSVGYSLTGNVGEEVLFLIIGPEATGKSTYIEAIKIALGDYAQTADFETFLRRRDVGGPRPDIARLAGARLVASIESEESRRLASGLVKQLTGGDTITARFLYGQLFEFKPQFTLWLATNHEPEIRDDDTAFWRRVLRAPFEHTVPKDKRDPEVKITLCDPIAAGPAILAWAVKGCLAWQENGLAIPAAVKTATAAYREAMDPLHDFFLECCEFEPLAWTPSGQLRAVYERWADENGIAKKNQIKGKAWTKRLRAMGCEPIRRGGKRQRGWLGVCLVDAEATEWVMSDEEDVNV